VVVASKFHELISSCYSFSLALTPYDFNVHNIFFKCNEKKKNKLSSII
jgi:hypothetical protein